MYYLYYTFKNDDPNKAYIGMTNKPINHFKVYKGSGIILVHAFKKYGKRNFTRIDLGEFENKDECHFWEGFYIKILKTLKSNGGYNISPAGGMGSPISWSEEMRNKFRGMNNPMYGKTVVRINREREPMSEETKGKIKKSCSESHKRLWEKYKFPEDPFLH